MIPNGPAASFDATLFAQLAEELHAAGDPVQTCEQVTATAVQVLEADQASITMIGHGRHLETVAATDPMVVQLDLLQYELGEGPCSDASWRGETLLSPDLPNDQRWPLWAPKAASAGIASMMAVELTTPERRVGALNLYFTSPRTFVADDVGFASIFGRHASIAVANATTNSQLNVALDSRKLIGQAQGILMERFNLSESQAFEVLSRYSQNSNVKLREVAEQLCSTRNLPASLRNAT